MSKILTSIVFIILITALSANAYAEDGGTLGNGYFALKVDYINFQEDIWETNDIEKSYYVAIEGYGHINHNIYVGGELGYARPTGTVSGTKTELTYIPFEVNVKYVVAIVKALQFDFGIGASAINVDWVTVPGSISGDPDEAWVLGAQGFVNFNLVIKRFFIGADAKYQVTQNAVAGTNLDNYRIGGHIGFTF